MISWLLLLILLIVVLLILNGAAYNPHFSRIRRLSFATLLSFLAAQSGLRIQGKEKENVRCRRELESVPVKELEGNRTRNINIKTVIHKDNVVASFLPLLLDN